MLVVLAVLDGLAAGDELLEQALSANRPVNAKSAPPDIRTRDLTVVPFDELTPSWLRADDRTMARITLIRQVRHVNGHQVLRFRPSI